MNNDTKQFTKIKNIVSSIWAEILQLEKIYPDDNFFELGGDSLMTMMVLFRVNDILHIELPPYTLNQSPTLREFCHAINDSRVISEGQNTPDNQNIDSFDEETGEI